MKQIFVHNCYINKQIHRMHNLRQFQFSRQKAKTPISLNLQFKPFNQQSQREVKLNTQSPKNDRQLQKYELEFVNLLQTTKHMNQELIQVKQKFYNAIQIYNEKIKNQTSSNVPVQHHKNMNKISASNYSSNSNIINISLARSPYVNKMKALGVVSPSNSKITKIQVSSQQELKQLSNNYNKIISQNSKLFKQKQEYRIEIEQLKNNILIMQQQITKLNKQKFICHQEKLYYEEQVKNSNINVNRNQQQFMQQFSKVKAQNRCQSQNKREDEHNPINVIINARNNQTKKSQYFKSDMPYRQQKYLQVQENPMTKNSSSRIVSANLFKSQIDLMSNSQSMGSLPLSMPLISSPLQLYEKNNRLQQYIKKLERKYQKVKNQYKQYQGYRNNKQNLDNLTRELQIKQIRSNLREDFEKKFDQQKKQIQTLKYLYKFNGFESSQSQNKIWQIFNKHGYIKNSTVSSYSSKPIGSNQANQGQQIPSLVQILYQLHSNTLSSLSSTIVELKHSIQATMQVKEREQISNKLKIIQYQQQILQIKALNRQLQNRVINESELQFRLQQKNKLIQQMDENIRKITSQLLAKDNQQLLDGFRVSPGQNFFSKTAKNINLNLRDFDELLNNLQRRVMNSIGSVIKKQEQYKPISPYQNVIYGQGTPHSLGQQIPSPKSTPEGVFIQQSLGNQQNIQALVLKSYILELGTNLNKSNAELMHMTSQYKYYKQQYNKMLHQYSNIQNQYNCIYSRLLDYEDVIKHKLDINVSQINKYKVYENIDDDGPQSIQIYRSINNQNISQMQKKIEKYRQKYRNLYIKLSKLQNYMESQISSITLHYQNKLSEYRIKLLSYQDTKQLIKKYQKQNQQSLELIKKLKTQILQEKEKKIISQTYSLYSGPNYSDNIASYNTQPNYNSLSNNSGSSTGTRAFLYRAGTVQQVYKLQSASSKDKLSAMSNYNKNIAMPSSPTNSVNTNTLLETIYQLQQTIFAKQSIIVALQSQINQIRIQNNSKLQQLELENRSIKKQLQQKLCFKEMQSQINLKQLNSRIGILQSSLCANFHDGTIVRSGTPLQQVIQILKKKIINQQHIIDSVENKKQIALMKYDKMLLHYNELKQNNVQTHKTLKRIQNKLSKQASQYMIQIERLKENVEQLKIQVGANKQGTKLKPQLENMINNLRSQLQQLQKTNREHSSYISLKNNKIEQLSMVIRDLEKQIQRNKGEKQFQSVIKIENQKIKKQLANLDGQYKKLTKQYQKIYGELSQKMVNNEKVFSILRQKQRLILQINKESLEKNSIISDLQFMISQNKTSLSSAQIQIKNKNSIIQKQTKQISQLGQKLLSQTEVKGFVQKQLSYKNSMVQKLTRQNVQLKNKLSSEEDTRQSLQRELNSTNSMVEKVTNQLNIIRQHLMNQSRAKSQLQNQIKNKSHQLDSLSKQITNVTQNLQSQAQAKRQLERQLSNKATNIEQLRKQISIKQNNLMTEAQIKSQLQNELNKKLSVLQKLSNEQNQIKRNLMSEAQAKYSLQKQLNHKINLVQKLSNELSQTVKNLMYQTRIKDNLQNQLRQKTNQIQKLSKQLNQVINNRNSLQKQIRSKNLQIERVTRQLSEETYAKNSFQKQLRSKMSLIQKLTRQLSEQSNAKFNIQRQKQNYQKQLKNKESLTQKLQEQLNQQVSSKLSREKQLINKFDKLTMELDYEVSTKKNLQRQMISKIQRLTKELNQLHVIKTDQNIQNNRKIQSIQKQLNQQISNNRILQKSLNDISETVNKLTYQLNQELDAKETLQKQLNNQISKNDNLRNQSNDLKKKFSADQLIKNELQQQVRLKQQKVQQLTKEVNYLRKTLMSQQQSLQMRKQIEEIKDILNGKNQQIKNLQQQVEYLQNEVQKLTSQVEIVKQQKQLIQVQMGKKHKRQLQKQREAFESYKKMIMNTYQILRKQYGKHLQMYEQLKKAKQQLELYVSHIKGQAVFNVKKQGLIQNKLTQQIKEQKKLRDMQQNERKDKVRELKQTRRLLRQTQSNLQKSMRANLLFSMHCSLDVLKEEPQIQQFTSKGLGLKSSGSAGSNSNKNINNLIPQQKGILPVDLASSYMMGGPQLPRLNIIQPPQIQIPIYQNSYLPQSSQANYIGYHNNQTYDIGVKQPSSISNKDINQTTNPASQNSSDLQGMQ